MKQEVIPLVEWIQRNGRNLGYRPPTTAERGRVLGMKRYFDAMHLEEGGFVRRTGQHL